MSSNNNTELSFGLGTFFILFVFIGFIAFIGGFSWASILIGFVASSVRCNLEGIVGHLEGIRKELRKMQDLEKEIKP
ncbi:MAG: hypothetical protein QMD50_01850 [Patescibacteria group bacterium]|nr:hypothetical protein [Patescibacteria group bacterium]